MGFYYYFFIKKIRNIIYIELIFLKRKYNAQKNITFFLKIILILILILLLLLLIKIIILIIIK